MANRLKHTRCNHGVQNRSNTHIHKNNYNILTKHNNHKHTCNKQNTRKQRLQTHKTQTLNTYKTQTLHHTRKTLHIKKTLCKLYYIYKMQTLPHAGYITDVTDRRQKILYTRHNTNTSLHVQNKNTTYNMQTLQICI